MIRIVGADPGDFLDYRRGSGGTVELYDIVVNSDRRKGVGRKLVEELCGRSRREGAKLVWAFCRSDNRIAREFYSAIGFRVLAYVPKFYPEGDAIMYGRDL